MTRRIKIADLELSQPLQKIDGLSGYAHLQILLRWHGQPIGCSKLPVYGDSCSASQIGEAVLADHSFEVLKYLLQALLRSSVPFADRPADQLTKVTPAPMPANLPSVTVAVCTRDRTEDLALCLGALQKLEHTPLEILVIDNAARTSATAELVEQFFPNVRYILEPRPGLDWARNRAIAEARGEILAYTDDDVIVDPLWTKNLARVFAENTDVMAVTGLVVPHELETEPQILFEDYGGFGRGFERKWHRFGKSQCRRVARNCIGAGQFGTGANMSYRRAIFSEIGYFDPALDVGTATQGGGDLDMFFRVLKAGHTLVYDPAAMVRHRHRRDFEKLKTQIASNGIGFYSHLVRNAIAFPEEKRGIVAFGLWWFWHWDVRRWLKSLFKPVVFPRELIWAELLGCFTGLFRYQKARRKSEKIRNEFGAASLPVEKCAETNDQQKRTRCGTAVRGVDIASGIKPISDVQEYSSTRIFVTFNGSSLGQIDIANHGCSISVSRLADAIVAQLGLKLLMLDRNEKIETTAYHALDALKNHLFPCPPSASTAPTLSADISVSIIVATCDRPKDLWRCLDSLVRQKTKRKVEIVVVDNCPRSGLASLVAEQFAGVRLINEHRPGASYARNAGFAASHGEILVSADDDVIAPPDWLEKLIAPFSRKDVMLVSGNVVPAELETSSQIQFENYGGLSRGFEWREFNRDWFDLFRRKAVPTWEIGGTANLALRAEILRDPEIGLLDETLGPGTPTGVGEDTYLFYRALKAGCTIIYNPGAFVWHKHRITDNALGKQIYNYSKGHVAYHLTTFLRDGDGRGLVRILAEMPRYHFWQICRWISGKSDRSLRTLFLELLGNLAGPWSLWASCRRVKKRGRSSPCISSAPKSPTSSRAEISKPRAQIENEKPIEEMETLTK